MTKISYLLIFTILLVVQQQQIVNGQSCCSMYFSTESTTCSQGLLSNNCISTSLNSNSSVSLKSGCFNAIANLKSLGNTQISFTVTCDSNSVDSTYNINFLQGWNCGNELQYLVGVSYHGNQMSTLTESVTAFNNITKNLINDQFSFTYSVDCSGTDSVMSSSSSSLVFNFNYIIITVFCFVSIFYVIIN